MRRHGEEPLVLLAVCFQTSESDNKQSDSLLGSPGGDLTASFSHSILQSVQERENQNDKKESNTHQCVCSS